MSETLPIRNEAWGFFGTMRAAGADPSRAWNTASAVIAAATGGLPEAVRGFLDSRHGPPRSGSHRLGRRSPRPQTAESAEGPSATHPAPLRGKARQGTKQAALIAMLKRPEGATIAEIVEVTGWQSHTVRGALAGALKKRLGLEVSSEKIEGRGRVYALA